MLLREVKPMDEESAYCVEKIRNACRELYRLFGENAARPLDVFRDRAKLGRFLRHAGVIEEGCLDEKAHYGASAAYIFLGLDRLLPLQELDYREEPQWALVVTPPPPPPRRRAGEGRTMRGKTLWEYQRGVGGEGGGSPSYGAEELKAIVREHVGSYSELSRLTGIPLGTIKTMFHLRTRGPAYKRVVRFLKERGLLEGDEGGRGG